MLPVTRNMHAVSRVMIKRDTFSYLNDYYADSGFKHALDGFGELHTVR